MVNLWNLTLFQHILCSSLLLFTFVNGDCSYSSCATNIYNPANQISYPFRAYDQPKICGLPGFDLGCNKSNQIPLLTFPSSQSFAVENILYSSKEIRISDPEGCLVEKVFQFHDMTNLVLYNCSFSIVLPSEDSLSCSRVNCDYGPTSSVLCANDSSSSILNNGCKLIGNVRVPSMARTSSYVSTLSLHWSMPAACQRCTGLCHRNPKDFSLIKCDVLPRGVIAIVTTALTMLFIIAAISYAICICRKRTLSRGTTNALTEQHQRRSNTSSVTDGQRNVALEGAVEQQILDGYPIMVVGESGSILNNMEDKVCAICLSDYVPNDILKMLPVCLHRFHADCVDEWLRANTTCPICRTPPPLT